MAAPLARTKPNHASLTLACFAPSAGAGKHHNLAQLVVEDALSTPLCHNSAIQRRLNAAAFRHFIDGLVATNNAQWLDREQRAFLIMWDSPDVVAAQIYAWAQRTGIIGDVVTAYDLYAGEDTTAEPFFGKDAALIMRALAVLEAQGKASVFYSASGEPGAKFFEPRS